MAAPAAKTLLGYADRISVEPGEDIAFKVSSDDGRPYDAAIVRLVCGDTNPAGPGYREDVVAGADWRRPGRRQAVRPGSCVVVPADPRLQSLGSFQLDLLFWPTRPAKADQTLVSLWEPARRAGFVLSLEAGEGLTLMIGDGRGREAAFALHTPVLEHRWYRAQAAFDVDTGVAKLRQIALQAQAGVADHGEIAYETGLAALGQPAVPLVFAARPAMDGQGYEGVFNGKLEAPTLSSAPSGLTAAWDFSIGIETRAVRDVAGGDLDGVTLQMPARGMTGHDWDGETYAWRGARAGYGAIHFHDDDLLDAGWETDFTWRAPDDLRSGLYAARLRGALDEDYVPFVVRPSPAAPRAKLLFLVPTASYQAYANEHLAIDAAVAETVHGHVPAFGPNDLYLAAHRELGGSLYDRHSDNSGIFFSSRLRPILNMRPKYQSWLGGLGSGLWQLNADTHLLAWLEHLGIDFDCITDEDLDAQGEAALAPYACVMTGTHPEYWSTRMLDGLAAYQARGGRTMYMGGNGLYWRIAYDPAGSGAVEVRRCEVGNGWTTAPGEAYQAFDGAYGGLWRRIGRPPQQFVGVGFVGEGFDRSSYYRRASDSFNPRTAFIFDGVEEEILGDFGLIGGGAAGLELDRTDPLLGTPANALILARSEDHTPNYLPTVEELLINYGDQAAISPVHAEMVFFETPSGGAVFSTGSIAWAGSLSHEDYENNVARISGNVLRRFLDPAPFETPDITLKETL
jgi:N,N-dimethylformamidase